MWEGRNGARPAACNEASSRIAGSAHRDLMVRLAEKHGIPARGEGPPSLTGGSDDHGGYDIARAWTETPPGAGPADLLNHLRAGRTTPAGGHGDATLLAHSVGSLALTAALERGMFSVPDQLRGIVGDLLQREPPSAPSAGAARPAARGRRGRAVPAPTPVAPAGLLDDVLSQIRTDRGLVRRYRRLGRESEPIHSRLGLVTGWLHGQMVRRALGPSGGAGLGRRAEALVGALVAAAPQLLAAHYMAGEERHAAELERAFLGPVAPIAVPSGALMLTDTFAELNGAAGTMRRLAGFAAAHPERGLTVVTCGNGAVRPGHHDLEPIARIPVPAYGDDAWTLGVPAVVDLLELARERRVGVIHAATPGPLGLAGLAVARTLGLPFVTTHHTDLVRYAQALTGDRLAAEVVRRALGWFYGQAERIYVPTRTVAGELAEQGVSADRLRLFTRGIDRELFHPGRRSRRMRRRMGANDAVVVLYVGRLSREKGIFDLARAMRAATASRRDLRLCLVGEGPARDDLKAALSGVPHRFLGALRGEDLAEAYASADIFCCPSATETYGQVVVEAAASGLPCVVSDAGAAQEHVAPGAGGLVLPAGDAASLADALVALAADPDRRMAMGQRAAGLTAARPTWDDVFTDLVVGYGELATEPAGEAPLVSAAPSRA